ncbi:MAG: hypothetical protein EOO46_17130 [Flavobacterium sp.]|nr:MAG: hypothetical protein EOO46_17130 [Flavobacterium sp.]
MEFEKLKSEIKEIVEIVKECPESLQEKCFEVLLMELLNSTSGKHGSKHSKSDAKKETIEASSLGTNAVEPQKTDNNDKENGDPSEEISMRDLHAKTRRFTEVQNIQISDINKIYYKSDGSILPLYDDIGTNRISESQIRLSLLTAFENSIDNGEFEFSGEVVRERCKQLKCYDAKNFTANFKNSSGLFDGFDQYEKDTPIKLSTEGKAELGKILKELAK